ncbi:MjaI restriction endonuclease [Sedimentisphaera salicampi]|uniref:MjaI restriction endonuclease n=2 Tax=Sedimentisphaera salicampi TaxID=1941349 RepID=A0A1W6LNF9_9BACT|nr:MjaI family restriction endonuclease [Sedimentisphaera salicampi]ARN57281.1 MjaI restriction endonuclease [Sedimentisphaera salicampi]
MNRFQLNFEKNVGPASENIRKCEPKTLQEWQNYYFQNVRSKEHIEELGRKLYVKITEVIQAEVEEITEQDCIEYIFKMVIDRTYDGYVTEINTVYGQLEQKIGCKIEPAPDEWDRLYNVDFYIKIKDNYLGIQIKPVSEGIQLSQIFKERGLQADSHCQFREDFGGKVFYVFSSKVNGKKVIRNHEVVEEIKEEIRRLEA